MARSDDNNSLSGENRYGFHANFLANPQKEGVPADFAFMQVAEPVRKLLETSQKAASLRGYPNPDYEKSIAILKDLHTKVYAVLKSHSAQAESAHFVVNEDPKSFTR